MGTLHRAGGGKLLGGDEALAEQALFVFAHEQDGAHDQVLRLADEKIHLGLRGAFVGRELLPALAMGAQGGDGIIQAGQETSPGLADFAEAILFLMPERVGFLFGKREQLAA